MNKKIMMFVLLLIVSLVFSPQVLAEGEVVELRQLDEQAKILFAYLETYNSPLRFHAQDFIDAAKEYNLDWRLVAAISGVESTFGQFIPGGYNAWGWGVYGNQAIYFNSWREGIYTVSQGLRENYLNKGLTEPYAMNRIYATSPYWGGKVTYFMDKMAEFAEKYQAENSVVEINPTTSIVAATSAQLAFK